MKAEVSTLLWWTNVTTRVFKRRQNSSRNRSQCDNESRREGGSERDGEGLTGKQSSWDPHTATVPHKWPCLWLQDPDGLNSHPWATGSFFRASPPLCVMLLDKVSGNPILPPLYHLFLKHKTWCPVGEGEWLYNWNILLCWCNMAGYFPALLPLHESR